MGYPLAARGSIFTGSRRIPVAAPTVFGMSFAQLMAPQWISRGKFVWTTSATVTAAIFNFFANMVLIPRFHLMGAVWVSLVTYLGLTVIFQFAFALWCERAVQEPLK